MLKGRLNLEGLPPGGYNLRVLLQLGPRAVDRSAPMTMAALDATLAQEVTRINAEKVSDEGYFKYMSTEGARFGIRSDLLRRHADRAQGLEQVTQR